MGLDVVELILAVEDTFGIYISDEEAGNTRTVGDVYDLVLTKIQLKDSGACLTSAAFYRLRRGIVETLGVNRNQVKPAMQLGSLFPAVQRRKLWRRLRDSMSLKLPPLEHPGWLEGGFLGTGCVTALALGWSWGLGWWVIAWSPLLLLTGMVAGVLTLRLFPILAVAFPGQTATVGDLARALLATNYSRLEAEVGSVNRDDVWQTLCRVFVEQTGVERHALVPEARIVDDLGID